jgi:hypothetical protein
MYDALDEVLGEKIPRLRKKSGKYSGGKFRQFWLAKNPQYTSLRGLTRYLTIVASRAVPPTHPLRNANIKE